MRECGCVCSMQCHLIQNVRLQFQLSYDHCEQYLFQNVWNYVFCDNLICILSKAHKIIRNQQVPVNMQLVKSFMVKRQGLYSYSVLHILDV